MRLRCPASARGVELVRGGAGRSGVGVPQELRAGRVARAPKPPAEAPDQPDGIAETRGWRQRARAKVASTRTRHQRTTVRAAGGAPSSTRAPEFPAGLVMRVGSSEFVPQFEGEGHGDELGVAVPQELRAGRVALAPEPPAQASDQTDGVAEARRRRQLA